MNIQISSIFIIIAHSTGFGNSFFKKSGDKIYLLSFCTIPCSKEGELTCNIFASGGIELLLLKYIQAHRLTVQAIGGRIL